MLQGLAEEQMAIVNENDRRTRALIAITQISPPLLDQTAQLFAPSVSQEEDEG